jgi:hypothetical protein
MVIWNDRRRKDSRKTLVCWPDTTRWRKTKETKKREAEYNWKTHIDLIMENRGLEDGD